MITAHTIINRSPDLVFSDIEGEVVMMSIEQAKYYGMDSVGSRIWKLLESPVKVGDMFGILRQEYEVTLEECERDVISFLNDLVSENLIEIVSE